MFTTMELPTHPPLGADEEIGMPVVQPNCQPNMEFIANNNLENLQLFASGFDRQGFYPYAYPVSSSMMHAHS